MTSACEIDWTATAAWVQAIGSIAAIVAAIWIGERSARRNRELVESERRRQADIVASTLAMKLHFVGLELKSKATRAKAMADRAQSGEYDFIDRRALNGLFLLSQHTPVLQLRSSVTMFDRDSGILVNLAMDGLESYNTTMETAIETLIFKGTERPDLIELLHEINQRMTDVLEMCVRAEQYLEQAHELEGETEASAP